MLHRLPGDRLDHCVTQLTGRQTRYPCYTVYWGQMSPFGHTNWATVESRQLVSWCFEPSHPQRITSGLESRQSRVLRVTQTNGRQKTPSRYTDYRATDKSICGSLTMGRETRPLCHAHCWATGIDAVCSTGAGISGQVTATCTWLSTPLSRN